MRVRINKLLSGKIVTVEKEVPDKIALKQLSLPRNERSSTWRDVEPVFDEETENENEVEIKKRGRKAKEGEQE